MCSRPPKIAEAVVAILVPPACREEVLGDLHERCTSKLAYVIDASRTVPLVILSRIRRTADAQILLIHAFVLFLSFLAAAQLGDRTAPYERYGLLRLAIPVAITLLGVILDDVYANPKRRSSLNLARAPLIGLAMAFVAQRVLWTSSPNLALPGWLLLSGSAMGLLLSFSVRMLFPPVTGQLLGTSAPAIWLKHAAAPRTASRGIVRIVKCVSALVAWLAICVLIAERAVPPKAAAIVHLVALSAVTYQIVKRD